MQYKKQTLLLVNLFVLSLVFGAIAPATTSTAPPPSTTDRDGHATIPTKQPPSISPSTQLAAQDTDTSTNNQQANASSPASSFTSEIEAADEQSVFTEFASKEEATIYTASGTYPLRTYNVAATATDPLSDQWWVDATSLPDAWNVSTGSSDTTIAVIDTGFALAHEDLADRWLQNSGELGLATTEAPSILNCTDQSLTLDARCNAVDDDFDGIVDNESGATTLEHTSKLNCTDQSLPLDKSCNLIDDDGNGYIDDATGWDFVNHDRSVLPGETNASGVGTRHGTSVASVAASSGVNGVGIAGVNWQASILPLQAIDDDGYGNTLTVGRAVRYATEQNVDVINMSLGGSQPDNYLRQAIREAIAAGIIVVAAAGNSNCNCIDYPGNYPEVVAVGALATDNTRAFFSSYGDNLDVMAPGTSVTAASWSASQQTSLYQSGLAGTSFAAPIVSGLLSLFADTNPNSSATERIALLTETTTRSFSETHSQTLGYGLTDANAAVQRGVTAISPAQTTSYALINHGDAFNVSPLFEADSTLYVYECDTPTTPVMRYQNGSDVFYSASRIEQAISELNGYTGTLFGYFCILQPHDSPELLRTINTYTEFENTFIKPLVS